MSNSETISSLSSPHKIPQNKVDKKFFPKLINGGIAGVVGTSLIFPLDVAKTLLQDQKSSKIVKVTAGNSAETVLYRNMFHCLWKLYNTEGVRRLYRGLGVNLAFVMPEKAIKLAANDQVRQYFGGSSFRKNSSLPLHLEVAAGAMAGFCQVIVTTPMEFFKIQMQTLPVASSTPGLTFKPKISTISVISRLIREHGLLVAYKGLSATMARDVFFSSIYFPIFAYCNSMLSRKYQLSNMSPPLSCSLQAGLLAGSFAAFIATPFDVIKTRLQVVNPSKFLSSNCAKFDAIPPTANVSSNAAISYNGIIDCASKTFKNEGISAFFKGCVPRMLVVAPLFSIAQTIYFLGIAEYLLKSM